jgi:hypothetical protein
MSSSREGLREAANAEACDSSPSTGDRTRCTQKRAIPILSLSLVLVLDFLDGIENLATDVPVPSQVVCLGSAVSDAEHIVGPCGLLSRPKRKVVLRRHEYSSPFPGAFSTPIYSCPTPSPVDVLFIFSLFKCDLIYYSSTNGFRACVFG